MTNDEALVEMDRQLSLGAEVITGPPVLVFAAALHGLEARTQVEDWHSRGRGRGSGLVRGAPGQGQGDGYGEGWGKEVGGGHHAITGAPSGSGRGDSTGFGNATFARDVHGEPHIQGTGSGEGGGTAHSRKGDGNAPMVLAHERVRWYLGDGHES